MDFIINNLTLLAGGTSAGLVLWLLKRIPNDKIQTKDLWNATIEPYFVDLIDNTIGAFVNGFINGLRSDD